MKTIETSTADAATEGLAPRRLLDGGGDDFERMLVEPSLSERVPRVSLERLARALELPPDALPHTARQTAPSAPKGDGSRLLRHASRMRLGAVGAVAVGLGLTGWGLASRERSSGAAPIVLEMAAVAAPEQREVSRTIDLATPASPAPEGEVAEPARASDVAPRALRDAPARQRSQPRAAAANSARQRGSSAEPLGLSAELRALEDVQRALADRNASAAAGALANYERQFERGELALEAELLGVEVALANGDLDRARTRAREIAVRPAAARYRQRIDALLRAADVSDPARSAGAKTHAGHIENAEANR